MSDPRNVAHDKKVIQEKKHHGEDPAEGAVVETVQPGKKPEKKHRAEHVDPATERSEAAADAADEVRDTVKAHTAQTAPHVEV